MTTITKTMWITILLTLTLIIPAIAKESATPNVSGKSESSETKLAFVIICKPAGRIMHKNRCLNADGYFHVIELEQGLHQFVVFRYGPPSDGIEFTYTVRGDEKINKLILNLTSNEVETGFTDLSVFQ